MIGTVGKVELLSIFATALCECWNVSDKYAWDYAADLKQLCACDSYDLYDGEQAFDIIKPGFHISRKDRKHMVANMFFKLSMCVLVFT